MTVQTIRKKRPMPARELAVHMGSLSAPSSAGTRRPVRIGSTSRCDPRGHPRLPRRRGALVGADRGIAKEHIEKPSDVLKVGQEIEAKIVDFNEDEKKISLSIKALLAPETNESEDADVADVDIDAVAAEEN